MKVLVEIPLDESGTMVLAEIEEADAQAGLGFSRAALSPDEVLRKTGGSIESAMDRVIRPTARVILAQLRELSPETIELELNLRLSGKAGVVFASSEVEGHLRVKLVWTPAARDTGGGAVLSPNI